MASPQKENGYTPIANDILDALAGIRIAGEARQCLDVIIRKTYGYNKKSDYISLSQFCLITHLSKSHICRNLLKLEQMNLIITQKGNDTTTLYKFNKDFDTWKPLPKKETITQKGNAITQKGNKPLPKKGHTKDNIQKTITKDIIKATPEENEAIIKILDIFKKINPTINYGHKGNRKACLDLVRQFTLKVSLQYATYAVQIQGQDYAPTITTPYQLKEKLAQLKIYYDKSNKSKFTSI